MDAEYLMRNARMLVYTSGSMPTHRRHLALDGKNYRYSRVVWNFLNPDSPVKNGEVIHHIDGDPLNDMPDNLQKMTASEHMSYHAKRRSFSTRRKHAIGKPKGTHCKRGHELSGNNVKLRWRMGRTGMFAWRECQACSKFRNARRYLR